MDACRLGGVIFCCSCNFKPDSVVSFCFVSVSCFFFFFFFQAEDGIRDVAVTGVQTCALPILNVVAHPGGVPGAVLLRGAEPLEGFADDTRLAGPGLLGRAFALSTAHSGVRSEERRVGKECRSRWAPYHLKKNSKEKVSWDSDR